MRSVDTGRSPLIFTRTPVLADVRQNVTTTTMQPQVLIRSRGCIRIGVSEVKGVLRGLFSNSGMGCRALRDAAAGFTVLSAVGAEPSA